MRMKSNKKRRLPALAKGQLWKLEDAHIQIVDLGQRLIHYKMLRGMGQMRRTQTTSQVTLEDYLKNHHARLVQPGSNN